MIVKNNYERGLADKATRKAEERKRLGEKVRKLRHEGMTYRSIAERLGISETQAKILETKE